MLLTGSTAATSKLEVAMAPSSTLALSALPTRAPNDAEPPARFALVLRPEQSAREVAAAVQTELAEFDPQIAPISPADHGVLVLELPTRTLHHTEPARAYAAGYALAEDFGLRTAEPDLPTPFFPEEEVPQPGEAVPEEIRFPPGCWVDAENLPPRWALDRLNVPAAWEFSIAEGRPARGAGIVIAQPDTGVVAHTELDGVVRFGGWDVLDRDPDPTDPLDGRNPGHGTGTASVVVSPEARTVAGSAPAASHMPIRAVTSVIQVTQVSVAEAIGHAVDNGAHVITMSLGGVPADVLERAVRRAVAADVIVLAAAGNCVRTVVWPARYEECIAVAGTNNADGMWRGTCRGSAVDIAAPAQNVLKAVASNGTEVGQGQGTSFAVALTAGVAALWLAHHGRADLIAAARARGETLQDMFRRLLRATARRPAGWNGFEMGAGIADARSLLAADLDAGRDRETVLPPDPFEEPGFSVASLVAETVSPEAADDPELDWVRFGPELATALLERQLLTRGDEGATTETTVAVEVSGDLAGAVRNHHLRDHLQLDDDLDAEVGEAGP
ncbi:S8 family peptidase [Pseudonocardia charpentierae]|uniref:S8 family serine peptidase n=1 Tax=Pseudonocardia charpentierae TaxID=3075545 RepID=A0ABU2NL16_9PSEU|nr:S8 family serine peptidase [Pseudonocardia sp. DSM 45834]MDT0353909.1 S8 family serine peptidase [Pseudonocardia sp. DSM 45834]